MDSKEQAEPGAPKATCLGHARLLWLNLALGLFLWFLLLTDYSLVGTLSDVVFPVIVFGVALVSRVACTKTDPRVRRRFLLPSLISGGLYTAFLVLMLIPPFTLGVLFLLGEYQAERVIERTTSPNGRQEAVVTFRPVGAYAGGNGRVFVTVRHRWLPGLERDVYAKPSSYAVGVDGSLDKPYVAWDDDGTIRVQEEPEPIALGICGGELPMFIRVPVLLLRSLAR